MGEEIETFVSDDMVAPIDLGQISIIVGDNGTGKTTIAKAVAEQTLPRVRVLDPYNAATYSPLSIEEAFCELEEPERRYVDQALEMVLGIVEVRRRPLVGSVVRYSKSFSHPRNWHDFRHARAALLMTSCLLEIVAKPRGGPPGGHRHVIIDNFASWMATAPGAWQLTWAVIGLARKYNRRLLLVAPAYALRTSELRDAHLFATKRAPDGRINAERFSNFQQYLRVCDGAGASDA